MSKRQGAVVGGKDETSINERGNIAPLFGDGVVNAPDDWQTRL